MPRTYNLKKRAEHQDETRLRIVEATVSLHQSIGGTNTTISAIAERAGVERATVYRHFPDERALLSACTGHYLEQNPPPEPGCWAEIDDREERLRTALTQIYTYHHHNEPMFARAELDMPQMPVLQEVLAPLRAYWQRVGDVLSSGWLETPESKVVTAAIAHAIAFPTWQSLVREQGLDDAEAVALMVGMVTCAASTPPESPLRFEPRHATSSL